MLFRQIFATALLLAASPFTQGFAPMPTPTKASAAISSTTTSLDMGYVPEGLSPAEYQKIKQQDRQKMGKDLGRLGPRGFQSRSMQAWQEAYERGETGHAFAPFGYREKLKKGEIRMEDVPYMVRKNGKWDNSDAGLFARKQKWSKLDRQYAAGGYKKEQSISILGSGPGFNWTGEKRDPKKNAKWLVPGLS